MRSFFILTILYLGLAAQPASAQEVRSRLYIPLTRHITVFKENSDMSLIIKDYLSSTREVDVAYFPYGEEASGGDISTDRAFTGHRKLAETGVYHAGARFYNPQLGIFTQADTVEGPHKYGYATNNPISNFDPDGHQSITGFLDEAARSLAAAAKKAAASGKASQARAFIAKILSREAVAVTEDMPVRLAGEVRVPAGSRIAAPSEYSGELFHDPRQQSQAIDEIVAQVDDSTWLFDMTRGLDGEWHVDLNSAQIGNIAEQDKAIAMKIGMAVHDRIKYSIEGGHEAGLMPDLDSAWAGERGMCREMASFCTGAAARIFGSDNAQYLLMTDLDPSVLAEALSKQDILTAGLLGRVGHAATKLRTGFFDGIIDGVHGNVFVNSITENAAGHGQGPNGMNYLFNNRTGSWEVVK